jgi:hypothetical protein
MTDTQPVSTASTNEEILAKLRDLAAQAAERLGLQPASATDDWAYASGEQVVSWAWLIPVNGDRRNTVNQGFRLRRVGSRQHLEVWGRGTKLDLSGHDVMGFPHVGEMVLTAVTSVLEKDM